MRLIGRIRRFCGKKGLGGNGKCVIFKIIFLTQEQRMAYPWFCRGDLDGFFGLFVDNLLQLMLISVLCQAVAGLPADFVSSRILPGAALSILIGNAFYAWQAKKLAESTKRPDTTALPYGINTLSLFAFIFLIMGPVYRETHSPDLAWKAGLFACFCSALIEIVGALAGSWLRRHTPRAALLTALAGIGLTFIAMGFVFQIFSAPLLALVPAFFILFAYGSRIRLPWGLPGGFVAVLLGTAVAWSFKVAGVGLFTPNSAPYTLALHLPSSSAGDLWDFIAHQNGWRYAAVIFPMGLFNVIGSLQNLESAEASGDRFNTRSSLLANGLGGLSAALLGSPFPTTIYIGHPGWKSMGARWGYSLLNGVVISALCLLGGVTLVLKIIPMEAMIGILLWIGLVIAAQAYKDVPRHHFLGVAFGFVPTLAAWLFLEIDTTLRVAGTDLFHSVDKFGADIFIRGVMALNQGFIISSMIFAAIMIHVVERSFKAAAAWCLIAAVAAFFGLIHAYSVTEAGIQNKFGLFAAPDFAAAYLGCAFILILLHHFGRFDKAS
jgi:AGZA family xanthine/uracil permease-like MFS transporter